MLAMEEAVEGRTASTKKRKRVEVEMEVLSETTDRIAPIVGYFPSGYDPHNAAFAAAGSPSVRVFRNQRHSSRLELVVSPRESNVEFVGTSYSGEAAGPQLCTYTLGVLDKETQTLKILPIAANKIFRLEPRLTKNLSADTEPSEGLAEEGLAEGKVERKIADLTNLYGTKKDRDKDNRWRLLNQQRNDPSTQEQLANENLGGGGDDDDVDNEAPEDVKEAAVPNIPPHDRSANTPEKAYLLDEIMPRAERAYLLDILENLQYGEDLASKSYPAFVYNRIHKLREVQDDKEKEKLACILSYITHLHAFWGRIRFSKHKARFVGMTAGGPKIPRIIYQKLLRMFVNPDSDLVSMEKKELLIGYILVLTLFVDKFHSDPSDIARDLKMTVHSLKPYYLQLGCKLFQDAAFQQAFMTLPVPLQFPESRRNRRRR
ncbi:DNA-directed RNA polymerase I subunit rpa49 [Phoenix dactylifera]|uniref:DNA-directed RNA polymerase I subunit rpa49 n=1 Tax=Phoenix dactylifera TaxID=42345 RepID=A0A8B7BQW6_PHODC|nr:DNA-directed RNA polymerase I subunit rpa49 [Phoenix dactylifera]